MADNCLETTDFEGRPVVFSEDRRAQKAQKHPELRDPSFVSGRIKEALRNPTFVYADYGAPVSRRAQYLVEFVINGVARYTKVIVECAVDSLFVVTAFRPDYVKERGKTTLLYGKDE